MYISFVQSTPLVGKVSSAARPIAGLCNVVRRYMEPGENEDGLSSFVSGILTAGVNFRSVMLIAQVWKMMTAA